MTCNECKHMTECKDDAFINTAKFAPDASAQYCTGFEPYTNADRIRAMSDEELKHIARAVIESQDCPMGETSCIDCVFHDLCLRSEYYYNNEEEWLQQPAGEEQNG